MFKKELACKQIRVLGKRAVIAEMKLRVMEDGEEIASREYSQMYHRSSDWSEAYPLAQRVCGLVFGEKEKKGNGWRESDLQGAIKRLSYEMGRRVTQTEIATGTGVAQSTLSRVTHKQVEPRHETLDKLAGYFTQLSGSKWGVDDFYKMLVVAKGKDGQGEGI